MKKKLINKLLACALALAGIISTGPAFLPLPLRAASENPPAPAASTNNESATPDGAMPEAGETATAVNESSDAKDSNSFRGRRHRKGNALISFGGSAVLQTNETVDAVVVIGGPAKVYGKVREAVVAVGGDIELDGAEVNDAVVAVLGNIRVGPGTKIKGDAVSVGGTVTVDDTAKVDGQVQQVDFKAIGLPELHWLRQWFVHCALKLRPLAPQVGWVWVVAGIYFLF